MNFLASPYGVYYWAIVSITTALTVISVVTGNYRIAAIALILVGIVIYDFQQHQRILSARVHRKVKPHRKYLVAGICAVMPPIIVYFSHTLPSIWLSVLTANLVLPAILSKLKKFSEALMVTLLWVISTSLGVVYVLYFGH